VSRATNQRAIDDGRTRAGARPGAFDGGVDRARRIATLLRWLGPWSTEGRPRGIEKSTIALGEMRVRLLVPRAPRGVYHVIPGLHYLGPDDVRLDRFLTILAAAGFTVVAPFYPAYVDLALEPGVFADAERAQAFAGDLARRASAPPPGVFSISFGSLLALHLASRPALAGRIGGVVVFGGFADLFPTVRFAVTGRAEHGGVSLRATRDPLNSPVVYLNLLPFLDVKGDRAVLAEAYRTMIRRTWGRMELKADGMRDGHAHAIARRLPEELRLPFLRGCGLAGGASEWLEDGIRRAGDAMSRYDATPLLPSVHARVTLVHGRDDDVIPYVETEKLAERLPRGALARKCITGLYGHTAAGHVGPAAILQEIGALAGMLADMAEAPMRQA
jgi:pimeloyl-ACP methyl ester carboxylesterase